MPPATLNDLLAPFLSRKFVLAVLCAVLGVVFLKDVSGSDKLDYLKWLLGIYAAANVTEKATSSS